MTNRNWRASGGSFLIIALVVFSLIFLSIGDIAFAKASNNQKTFSVLKITEISVKGSKLHIRGETDLPKGSSLHLKLATGTGLFGGNNGGKGIKIHANSHFFFVQVDLPKGKKQEKNIIRLRLRFDPSRQQQRIRALVGPKGENLAGRHVLEENDIRIMQFDKFMFF
jgi:hypothetical protein